MTELLKLALVATLLVVLALYVIGAGLILTFWALDRRGTVVPAEADDQEVE